MIVVRLLYRQDEIIPFLWFEFISTTSEKSLNQTQMVNLSLVLKFRPLYAYWKVPEQDFLTPHPPSTPYRIESAYFDLNL